MKLSELRKLEKSIKIEVSLNDLYAFGEYLIHNTVKNNTTEESKDIDIGGIETAILITGYAKSTIYNLVNAKKLPCFRKHGRLYFSKRELLDFIKSGRQELMDEDDITKYLK